MAFGDLNWLLMDFDVVKAGKKNLRLMNFQVVKCYMKYFNLFYLRSSQSYAKNVFASSLNFLFTKDSSFHLKIIETPRELLRKLIPNFSV